MKTTEEILAWVDNNLSIAYNINPETQIRSPYGIGFKDCLELLREYITSEEDR